MPEIPALSSVSTALVGVKPAAQEHHSKPVMPPELNNYVQIWMVEVNTSAQTADALLALRPGGQAAPLPQGTSD